MVLSLHHLKEQPLPRSSNQAPTLPHLIIDQYHLFLPLLKRIIRKQVVVFMNRQGRLNNTQHVFRSGRSWLSALLDVFDDLIHMLSSDTTVDMIYLDFQRPLTNNIMMYCCTRLGITGKLGIWFFQFLTNRWYKQRQHSFEWCSPRHSPGTTIILNYDIRHQ